MKRTQFSVEPIVAVLKQAELGLPVADLICQTGISEQTFFRWRKQCAGIDTVQGVQAALGCECAAEAAWWRTKAWAEPLSGIDRPPLTGPRQTLVHCGLLGLIGLCR
jgi:hypothetical protein